MVKSLEEIINIYNTLNEDISHQTSRDDICTPMECVQTMIDYIPEELWKQPNLTVLDACCGNGNFGAYCSFKTSIDNIYFNDINETRLNNCKQILNPNHITNQDIFTMTSDFKYDLIMANPPYSGGGNKNQSLSNKIIRHCITLLKDNGYLCFITPNNWMTYNNNNETLHDLLKYGRFIIIDNDAKKYFSSVGSSFTIFIWQKNKNVCQTLIKNNYLIKDEQYVTIPNNIPFIPLYISQDILNIVQKGISTNRNQFNYRCDLHNYTQKDKLNDFQTDVFKYETIHTINKTRYSSIKQDIYDKWVIIVPLSTYYIPFIKHNINTTQSVGYIAFDTENDAKMFLEKMNQHWIKVLIHLTRYGNFNNIMVLKYIMFDTNINFTEDEQKTIETLYRKIKY